MKKISFIGKVEDDDIRILNPSFFKDEHDKFIKNNEGKHVEVIYKVVDKRSLNRFHSFYRGVILPALNSIEQSIELHITEEETHMQLKREFMYVPIKSLEELPEGLEGHIKLDYDVVTDKDDNVKTIFKGYIKSTALYDKEEWIYFLKKCKERLTYVGVGVKAGEYKEIIDEVLK